VQSGRKQKDIGSINHSHRLPGPIEKTRADRKLVLAIRFSLTLKWDDDHQPVEQSHYCDALLSSSIVDLIFRSHRRLDQITHQMMLTHFICKKRNKKIITPHNNVLCWCSIVWDRRKKQWLIYSAAVCRNNDDPWTHCHPVNKVTSGALHPVHELGKKKMPFCRIKRFADTVLLVVALYIVWIKVILPFYRKRNSKEK
jgi:hypothetical protein